MITIGFFVFLAPVYIVLGAFIKWFALIPVIALAAWGMTWPKKVRVYCTPCGWAQSFLVSVRG